MSYVRLDDQHDDGQLTQFRERLSREARAQTGEEFLIFQDRNDIAWGQNWQTRINETLDAVTLLIPIITPSFFRSPPCREELERFLDRERTLGRGDLILPVYYISTLDLDDPERRSADELAQVVATRQYADWRELRFEPFTSPVVRRALAHLASRMRDTSLRSGPAQPAPSGGSGPAPATPAGGAEATATEPAASARPTAKTEPPTHVVDPFPNRGDFTTISAAITAAQPGDRILVRPGLYQEGLVVDKPLELLGDGPVADIEVQARGSDVVLFKANIGRVANLTLRQAGGGQWNGVDITQGRLELEGCDITSQSLSCVIIRNGADPRLRRNHIHHSSESGVLVYNDGLGMLEDNDLTANGLAGVSISTGGNPTLRNNRIHDNQENGIHVYDSGLGSLEDNDITANRLAGVEIKTGANPTLRHNRIHDNQQNGVFVQHDGLGMLEDNDITANHFSGVEIKTGANPTLRHNQIHDNQAAGVYVHDNGLGILEDNDITANGSVGVEIKSGANPTVRNNRINRNGYQAVWVYEGGGGVVEDNDLTGNTQGPWNIAEDSEANVTRSRNRE